MNIKQFLLRPALLLRNNKMNKEKTDVKHFFIIFIIFLTILLGSSLTWSIYQEYQSANEYALIEASSSFNKDLLYRRWATMHGGVYVPITETTPPNPYLEFLPERDITTQSDKKLTLVDHAYMTRQVHSIAESQYGIKGHITSLRPIRPENKADVWETKALKLFEKGDEEFSSIEKMDGKEYLRYMHLMKVENNCLKCHSNQGYKLGDIRGGISVSVPLDKYDQIALSHSKTLIVTYLLIYFLLITLSIFAYKRFLKEMIKRNLIQQKVIEREAALHDSHEDLYRLLNSMYEGAYGVDINGNCTFVNRAFLRILGYHNDHEVLGKHMHELIHHSHCDGSPYPSNECRMYRAYQINQPINVSDEVFWRKDGVAIPVEYWSHPIEKDGVVIGSIATFIDTTERKLAEEALKQLNSELENLHNNLDEAVFSVDIIHNKMLHVSIAHETVFGYSPEEFFNNPQLWYEIIAPEDKPIIDAGYPVLFSGKNLHHEYRIVHPDGHMRWIEAKMNPTLDTSGKLIRIDGIASDITDRKRAEIELFEKEVQYHNLADSGLALIWTAGTDKLCNYFNEPWLKFTGRTFEQELGNGWAEGVYPDDFDSCLKTYVTAFDNRKKFDMEYRLRHVNGEYRWIRDIGTPSYNSSGVFIGYIGHCFDITEHKQAEKELIFAKEKAEESDNLKASFLHNISHEIRTPLNGLLGFLSVLQDSDVDPGQRDEYIDIINKSAYRFMNTVDDIVEVSQIQAGLLNITAYEINVHRLISELCHRYQPEAEFKGLKFFLKDELPVSYENLYTDDNKLNGIISILLNNAIKFTKEGSIVFAIKMNNAVEPIELEFSVKDTGVGIPEDKRQTIFERFRQVDGSDSRPFEGSALGLFIAKAYVEMLGGKIWLESDPDGKSGRSGSTFYFTIPYNSGPTEKTDIKKVVSSGSTVNPINPEVPLLKILIVEDDEVSESFLRIAIKLFSKEILRARNGVEAVEACRKNPNIDLILMDIKMSGMSGYEATRQIRQFNKKVVIIAQTAFGLIDDRQKAIESGCNDYISKPVKKNELINLVEKYFGRQEKS
jgi:PAS domain S-box-containing protein